MLLLLCCIAVLLHLVGLPWWAIMLIVFIASVVKPLKSGGRSFGRGFMVVFISWVIICAWSGWQNGYVLSSRVASLLWLPHWSLLILFTGLLGGIIGGLSGLSGYWVQNMRPGLRRA